MEIDLLLPGLFDRLADWSQSYSPMETAPVFEKMLAMGTRAPASGQSLEATIWPFYDPGWNPNEELPSARMLSGIMTGTVFHAEPVHLKAGMSDLILFRPDPPLGNDEKSSLLQEINDYFTPRNIRFSLDEQGNGYLVFPETMHPHTTELSVAVGHGVFQLMPRGNAANRLGRLSNEIQMLLHNAPFNQQREQNSQLSANALWLWGSGDSQRPLQPRHEILLSNHPFALACASKAGQASMPLPETFATESLPHHHRHMLIVLDTLQSPAQNDDIFRWQQSLKQLEQAWLQPLQEALRTGKLKRLRLHPCNGRSWSLTPRSRWKLWRRSRPLASWL